MEYIVKYNGDIASLGYPTELLSENYAILELEPIEAQRLSGYRQVEYYEPAEILSPALRQSLDAACITPVQRTNGLGLTGSGVIVGIIDSGLDLTHPEFLTDQGTTRVLSLWDMTAAGQPPPGFRRGALFDSAAIDAGAASSQDLAGHGTAVASIAAGRAGVAPGASLVVVKLGEESPRSTDVMRAIRFLLDQAVGFNMPFVINLSYGTNNGSHRGMSLFETFIDEMAQRWKSVFVFASGNEGDAGHHFSGTLTAGAELPVEFTVATRRESLYLSLWKNFVDTASFELILPNGRTTGPVTQRQRLWSFSFGDIQVTVRFSGPTPYAAAQEVFFLLQGPPGGMDGSWQLLCYGQEVVDGRIDIWLPTVEEVTRRTAFLRPDTDLTITLPATAMRPISVGGYRPATETISAFSGRGDQLCRGRVLLDLTAPAEDIYAARPGGGYDRLSGTSMAAPFVSGSAALMMEWGIVRGNDPNLYGQRVKAFLCKSARRSPLLAYPNPLWGYGRLRLCDAMNDLINQQERSPL